MGGFGSGSYCRSGQATIEECLTTNIGLFVKLGFLENGVTGTLSWHCAGERRGSATVIGGNSSITLKYVHSSYYEESEEIEQPIHIERTRCHFGGSRPWFVCPKCQR